MKTIIYQVFMRLFGNNTPPSKHDGDIHDNGCAKMNDIDDATLAKIRRMGVTHVWYTGIIRHATTTDYSKFGIPTQTPMVVKGKAGSPYAITDYYDVDPDLAVDVEHRMEEFEALVERTHNAGLKVVIDFVPNHVAREYHSISKPEGVKDLGEEDDKNLHFSNKNNFYYCWGRPLDTSLLPAKGVPYEERPAKATGNDQFDSKPGPNDWYETVKLNYGIDYCDAGGRSEHFTPIPNTWSKMTDILIFWARKKVDAFRCDMAEMVPAAFWRWVTDKVKCLPGQPVQFIGEVYDPAQYRNYLAAGFDFLYDKVGMYDCLRDVVCHRRPAADITRQWQTCDDILTHMLYFMENHDEQRIASEFFANDARKGVPAMMVCAWLNTSPVMVYAGQELGERGMDEEGFSGRDGRTTIFDYWSPDTLRRWKDRRKLKKEERELMDTYTRILTLANSDDALRDGAFYDLMYVNPQLAQRQFAFMRKCGKQLVLVVVNFDEQPAHVEVSIPEHAFDYWQMPKGDFHATDLFGGAEADISLLPGKTVALDVPPLGGCAWKMALATR
ncbi:MAG: alpha-amylase [Prevotella sp.]|nr:alpha-amylase [Prevotella sp.]